MFIIKSTLSILGFENQISKRERGNKRESIPTLFLSLLGTKISKRERERVREEKRVNLYSFSLTTWDQDE